MMRAGGGEGKDKHTENIKRKWYGTITKTLNSVLRVFHICVASYSKILYKLMKYLQIRQRHVQAYPVTAAHKLKTLT